MAFHADTGFRFCKLEDLEKQELKYSQKRKQEIQAKFKRSFIPKVANFDTQSLKNRESCLKDKRGRYQ